MIDQKEFGLCRITVLEILLKINSSIFVNELVEDDLMKLYIAK